MRIDGRQIGDGAAPWIIAELSGEHCGDIDRARQLIAAAKRAGADSVKVQLYHPARLANARGGTDKVLTGGHWEGRSLGDLYQEAHTPKEWFPDLFETAKEVGVTIFASVFDTEGVDYLQTLGCPAYKVASFELTDLDLIRHIAWTGKPITLSTGMASKADIDAALGAIRDVHEEKCAAAEQSTRAALAWIPKWDPKRKETWKKEYTGSLTFEPPPPPPEVAVLHCVSAYPCPINEANLLRMLELPKPHGLSDHTLGTIAPIIATALGAAIIEKHLTLDRKNGGPDAAFSLEPDAFARMVADVLAAHAALGGVGKSEDTYRDLRRSSP